MRLLGLGLDRYGHFTGRQLDFDPAARLAVVCGANEAGKSTALRAVADALFGIEERSPFNFLHDHRKMRLSATLTDRTGRTLSFARRKGRAATLIDPATEAPLPDDSLVPFLGAYDRRAFLDIFALDQARLREGGRKLLAGGGDLADTLLAAAPGLGRIAALRDRLKASAGQVFNPDRKNANHAFYIALEKRRRAHTRVQELELRADAFRAVRAEAAEAAAARDAAVRAEIDAGLATQRARMLMRAARELRQIDAEQAAHARFGDLPQMAPSLVATARRLLAERAKAAADEERAAAEAAAAEEARTAIAVDGAVLAAADDIVACDDERATIEKARSDLPNRRREAETARLGLARIAEGLALPSVEELRARLPGPPALARAERLADRIRAHEARADALAEEQAKHAQRREQAAPLAAEGAVADDPAPLERRLVGLDGAEERERALRILDRRLGDAGTALAERIARLPHGPRDAESIAAARLPDLATAEAALRAIALAEERVAREQEALDALRTEQAAIRARLDRLLAGGRAPTAAVIADARASRDALWRRLRAAATGARPVAAQDSADALALDGAIGEADRLADDRQTEAERLAAIARAELDLAERAVRLEALAARLAAAQAQLAAAIGRWGELWPAGCDAPPADARGLAFLREVEAIRQAREALRREEADAEAARAAHASDRAEAERLRHDLGLPPRGPAPLRMAELREAVAARSHAFQAARDRMRDLALLEQAAADLARRQAALAPEQAVLAEEARLVLPPLAIRPQAAVEEARAALGLWREALRLTGDLATAERRIAAIEQNEVAFVGHVEALLQRLGADAAADDAASAARRLRARLDAAREARAHAEAAERAAAARRNTLAAARAARIDIDARLGEILRLAGIGEPGALGGVLDQLEAAAACAARLADARRRLADIAGGIGEEEVRRLTGTADDEALARREAEAAAAHETARTARDRAVERDTRAGAARDALDHRTGAAGAAQEEQDAIADIARAMEDFTRDHVAARLLTAAIERYRAEHQNPIVERASQAFAALTGGRWSGIAVDYDADPPRLAAVRDGTLNTLDALSEGTADQLFLALRVAAIEEHARRATPLPFLADDLFVSFDEARTEAGLRLLAELGALTQVIVFTHHAHVAEAARRALAAEVQVLQL